MSVGIFAVNNLCYFSVSLIVSIVDLAIVVAANNLISPGPEVALEGDDVRLLLDVSLLYAGGEIQVGDTGIISQLERFEWMTPCRMAMVEHGKYAHWDSGILRSSNG